MKTFFILAFTALSMNLAHADSTAKGTQDLLEASASCNSPNNPIVDGLKKLGGNSFANVQSENLPEGASEGLTEAVKITADLVYAPFYDSTLITRPNRVIGKMTLIVGMEPRGPGYSQVCNLSIIKAE